MSLLLVGAFVALDAAVLLAMRLSGEDWPQITSIVALGLAFGQTAVAATYFIFGRLNVVLRSVLLILVAGAMGYLGNRATGARHFGVWWGVMFGICAPLVVVALLARLRGVRLAHRDDPPGERRWQMSLWELFSLTTAIALQLGVVQFLQMPPESLVEIALFCLTINILPLVCLTSTLGLRQWAGWAGGALLFSPLAGVALAYTGFPPPDIEPLAAMTFVQALCLLAAGSVLRVSGYRLQRGNEEEPAER